MNTRALSWIFTHNNYDKEAMDAWDAFGCHNNVRYLVFGEEIGQSGTMHLQGFFQLVIPRQKRILLNLLEKLMEYATQKQIFLKQSKNDEAAMIYCKKEEKWIEWGLCN
jgi:hypothetical protein